jgi:hypothetical protein
VPSQLRLIDYLGTNRKTGTLLERFGYGRYADAMTTTTTLLLVVVVLLL